MKSASHPCRDAIHFLRVVCSCDHPTLEPLRDMARGKISPKRHMNQLSDNSESSFVLRFHYLGPAKPINWGPFLEIRANPDNKNRERNRGAIKRGFMPLRGHRFLLQGPRCPLRGHQFPLQALSSPYGEPF